MKRAESGSNSYAVGGRGDRDERVLMGRRDRGVTDMRWGVVGKEMSVCRWVVGAGGQGTEGVGLTRERVYLFTPLLPCRPVGLGTFFTCAILLPELLPTIAALLVLRRRAFSPIEWLKRCCGLGGFKGR